MSNVWCFGSTTWGMLKVNFLIKLFCIWTPLEQHYGPCKLKTCKFLGTIVRDSLITTLFNGSIELVMFRMYNNVIGKWYFGYVLFWFIVSIEGKLNLHTRWWCFTILSWLSKTDNVWHLQIALDWIMPRPDHFDFPKLCNISCVK